MAAPGTYTVTLVKETNGEQTVLAAEQEFELKRMHEGSLDGASMAEVSDFWNKYNDLGRESSAMYSSLYECNEKVKLLKTALQQTPSENSGIRMALNKLTTDMSELTTYLEGSPSKSLPGEKATRKLIGERMFSLALSLNNSTYGPTETNKQTVKIIESEMETSSKKLRAMQREISRIAQNIVDAGGPFIKGEY